MYFEFRYEPLDNSERTTCLLRPSKGDHILAVGQCWRNPNDRPNRRKARNLAAERAIRNLIPGDRRTDPAVLQERRLAWEALRAQGVRV